MKPRTLTFAVVPLLLIANSACTRKVVAVKAPQTPVVAASNPAPPASTPVAQAASEPARTTPTEASRMPDEATRARIQELLDRIQDIYFDYNEHNLRPDALAAVKQDANTLTEIIRQYPDFRLIVEGYCDERGSDAYNLTLGDARAKKAQEYLTMLGLPDQQLKVISYGKEKQICDDHTEACWQKNRRVHIAQSR